MKKPDKETREVLSLGAKYHDLQKSEDWAFAKSILNDKIKVLDSISTLPKDITAEEKIKQLETRAGAIELIESWIKEIEDSAELHIENQAIIGIKTEQVILRYEQ